MKIKNKIIELLLKHPNKLFYSDEIAIEINESLNKVNNCLHYYNNNIFYFHCTPEKWGWKLLN